MTVLHEGLAQLGSSEGEDPWSLGWTAARVGETRWGEGLDETWWGEGPGEGETEATGRAHFVTVRN